jgi:uracil-DNA glycosylase family 4
VAHAPEAARRLNALGRQIESCRRCPRLVAWREAVADEPRRAYAGQRYWAKPVAGFGDPSAWLVVVGLAPAAHGANRTGRLFTGDRSGEWLYRALYRAGLANRPESTGRHDGLELKGAFVTAAVRCAPPDNKPTALERSTCLGYLRQELATLSETRVLVALGAFALQSLAMCLELRPRPRFGHLVDYELSDGRLLVCSYHPSQQNTFTNVLTEEMFDAVFARAAAWSGR